MPSILEVDTIKNKTGTQNTVLSTDGSGNNTISVANIKANDGTAGLTIADSTGQVTGTLGSATVFPAGMVRNVVFAPTFASQDFDTDEDVIIQLEIPNVLASSKIYVSYKAAARITTGSTAGEGIELKVYRGGTSQSAGVASDGSRVSPDGGNANSMSFVYKTGASIELYCDISGFFIDESPDTGTNRYKLVGSGYEATPQVGVHDGQCLFSLMEITG
tara:strand:+ start:925 stop:1578 length:654 start_codon:yes stop_codon:yes gene_type:complete